MPRILLKLRLLMILFLLSFSQALAQNTPTKSAAAEYNVVKDNPKIAQAIKDKLAKKWQVLADRALESYAHAYILANKLAVRNRDIVEKIKPALIELYQLRRNVDVSKLDAFAESISEKPITDPAITVNP